MNTGNRRKGILAMLEHASAPLSAAAIAAEYSVSRQVIVGDIALLRASGASITATPRGYILERSLPENELEITIVCRHNDNRMAEELYTIVDLGGTVIDVTVEHSVYGQICAPLHIASRYDADTFLYKLQSAGARPLCDLTEGIHLHRLRCPNAAVQQRILTHLEEKGLLLSK